MVEKNKEITIQNKKKLLPVNCIGDFILAVALTT